MSRRSSLSRSVHIAERSSLITLSIAAFIIECLSIFVVCIITGNYIAHCFMLYNDVVQHFFSKCKVNKFFFMTKCFAVKNIHSLPTSRPRIHLHDMGGVPIPARRPYRVVGIYCLRRHSLGIRTTAISTMLPVLLSRIIMTNGWLNIVLFIF